MTAKFADARPAATDEIFRAPLDPQVTYPPVGRCIYCLDDGVGRLGDEHIIAYALNGTRILPQASCPICGGITSYLDGFAARSVFYHVRSSAGMRSRRKLPDAFPVILSYADGRQDKVMVPADIHPSTLVLPRFDPPDLLSGRKPDGNFRFQYTTWMRENDAFDAFKRSRGAVSAEVEVTIKPQQFSRVLAKIAHSFTAAELGLGGFKPLLLDLIHARVVANAPELVGSEPATPPPAVGIMHQMNFVPHDRLVVVRIRLFASSSINGEHPTPVYLVVAGERI
jgi:hypothetical protein